MRENNKTELELQREKNSPHANPFLAGRELVIVRMDPAHGMCRWVRSEEFFLLQKQNKRKKCRFKRIAYIAARPLDCIPIKTTTLPMLDFIIGHW